MGIFDQPKYTESDLKAMGNTSLKDGLSFTMDNTQREIQDRLERGEDPERIASEMQIPKSHVVLIKK